jgi:hypothetical protein
MFDETTPWTTQLGALVQQLNYVRAPQKFIDEYQMELIHAIQCVKFVRKCYDLPSYHK